MNGLVGLSVNNSATMLGEGRVRRRVLLSELWRAARAPIVQLQSCVMRGAMSWALGDSLAENSLSSKVERRAVCWSRSSVESVKALLVLMISVPTNARLGTAGDYRVGARTRRRGLCGKGSAFCVVSGQRLQRVGASSVVVECVVRSVHEDQ